jgi:Bacterial Ig-like domain (group 1)/Fibronectin type III domain
MYKKINKLLLLIFLVCLVMLNTARAYAGNPPDASHSSLSGTEVPANGTTQSTVTVVLQDVSGTPLTGDSVQLSDSSDPTITISPSSAVLDATGSATFTATSTTAGTDSIDVTDTTTSTTLPALGQIIFDPVPTSTPGPTGVSAPAPTSTTCTTTAPTDAPNLYSVVAVNGTATLYITPPTSTFDGFTISYGLDSNANSYSINFSQGATTGAVQYTISSLTPNTTYYYKVRANNGCASGPWSNVRSSSNKTSLPVTGPSNVISIGLAALLLSVGGLGTFIKNR